MRIKKSICHPEERRRRDEGSKRVWILRLLRSLRMTRLYAQDDKGFTLIEILLVVIIIGILVSLVAPRLAGRSEEAREQAAKADIEGGMALALDMYELDNGRYPAKLEDLLVKPSDSVKWRGPYFKKSMPKDPWGSPYFYVSPGARHPEGYDLHSAGPDKKEGTEDDIVN